MPECDCQIDVIVEAEITVEVSPEPEVTVIVTPEGVQGPPGTGSNIVAIEVPSGSINGSNVAFTAAFDFVPETVVVWVNGLLQASPADYVTSGARTVTLSVSPITGDTVHISYRKV